MAMNEPPLLGELKKYLEWEWDNGLTYIELPKFIPPENIVKKADSAEQISKAEESALPKTINPQDLPQSRNSHAGSVMPRLSVNSLTVKNNPGKNSIITLPGDQSVAQAMAKLRREWVNCTKCRLCEKRHNFVFGEGSLQPRLLFVGEGPGENEDLQGRPFVGRAGELLTNLIKAMGLRRESVFITNIVKCRPPNNRDPAPDEVETCNPLLKQQINLLKPEVMVALGKPATHLLLNTTAPISKLRGNWYSYQGIPLMPTFHPAYLLRNPADKGLIWSDMCKVLEQLKLPVPVLQRTPHK